MRHSIFLVMMCSVVFGAWIGQRHASLLAPLAVFGGGTAGLILLFMRFMDRHMALLLLGSLVLLCGATWRSHHEWQNVQQIVSGKYVGQATLRTDPVAIGKGVKVILDIDHQRFETWLYGRSARRISRRVAGEAVWVDGVRRPLDGRNDRRRQIRHIVGRFTATSVRDIDHGSQVTASRFEMAANRVRSTLSKGAQVLRGDQATLFAGLVYGDDTRQPRPMIERFRSSGLAHLTAVSGQNVAFMLTICAPILTRLRRWIRLTMTLLILAWFAVMTRLEPSVMRAVTMAAISATVFAVGGRWRAWQVLVVTMTILIFLDPFLLWSVGWWLSIGGSAGLILLSPAVETMLQRIVGSKNLGTEHQSWILRWLVPTIAAQIGVLPFIVLVFGWPSAVSLPCNALAVPVAGLVMLVGIPAAAVAGLAPQWLAEILMWPLGLGVRWVDSVAALGAQVTPPHRLNILIALLPMVLLAWFCLVRPNKTTPEAPVEPGRRVGDLGDVRI